MEVVATCVDFDSLLAAVESERPDVVVTDIRMPPTATDEGIRAAATLRETQPEVGVVVLSQHDDPAYALALLEFRLRGPRLSAEGAGPRRWTARRGRRGGVAGRVGDRFQDRRGAGPRTRGANSSPLAELTSREREVLGEIAQGKSNSAIAESLVLTKRAVEKHINAIFMKLGLAQADDVSKRVKATLIFLAQTDGRLTRLAPGVGTHPLAHTGKPHCGHVPRWQGASLGHWSMTVTEVKVVRVLTVDDQVVFRHAARDVISATAGFEPVGDVGSGEQAVAAVERLRPDLVLLDVRMPGIGGIEAARRIREAHPGTVVVLISIEDSDEFAEDARAAGAAALVSKQDFGPALLRSIWDAHGAHV